MSEETKEKTTKKEVQPQEIKEEKARKLLVIIVVLLFFGCTYYYYGDQKLSFSVGKVSRQPAKQAKAKNIVVEQTKPDEKQEKTSEVNPVLEEAAEVQTEKAVTDEETVKPEEPKKAPVQVKHKPTDRSYLAGLSKDASGKKDPFSFSESRFNPYTEFSSSSSAFLPTQNLPEIPGFSHGNGLIDIPPVPKPEEAVVVKGFLGQKVIAKVNGVVQSLKENDVVNNVKVISINPSEYTVKFEIDGKPVTKTMKSLTDRENKDIEIVKKLPQV